MQPQSKSYQWHFFILLVIIVCLYPVAQLAIFAYSPWLPHSDISLILQVHRGENPNEIARNLTQAGVVGDAKQLIWLGRVTRQWKNIKTGEYKFSPSMTPIEIFTTLASGISVAHPVTVREGENMYEIAADLAAKGLGQANQFLKLSKDREFIAGLGFFKDPLPLSLEGYFFPDTYFFNRALSDADIIKQMVKHFFSYWGQAQDDAAQILHLSRHEIVTLASIIEKETGAPEERPIISSVFYNRLKVHMKLQSDPTTIYGMWDTYRGKIHHSDFLVDNPYNTYFIKALPIGPIANPGKDALEAALHPSVSPFLYFVSHNDGTHQFSQTYAEHNSAVQKFQVDPKAHEGKSWRDLKKRTQ